METIAEHACFGGTIGFYRHASAANNCDMQFSVFRPPQSSNGPVPVVTYLAGLTCTEETFMIKAGAQRIAADLGLMLVAPDTSPRGDDVPDDPDGAYDFGLGAGFYLNATEAPWNRNFHMYDYLTKELPELLFASFPGDRDLRTPIRVSQHLRRYAVPSIVPGARRRSATISGRNSPPGATTMQLNL
jgi:S-formylglutathione hydrolase